MATSSYYAWGADWMPLSVLLHAEAMYGITDAIAAEIAPGSERGRESGGILLGSIDSVTGAHPVVRIEKLDPIESEHRRGPSFVLTDRDKRALATRLAWWNGRRNGHLRPVGFYRSHTRRGLYLDNADFALIQAYFPEPYAVFLLVRPERAPSNVGGFFFREEGDMHRESSYQEFPFDPVRVPLISPAPAIVPPVPVRAATTSGLGWLQVAIPLAAMLVLGLTFYAARTLTMARQPVAVNHPALRPLLRATAAATMDKPSPLKPNHLARTPAPFPLRNSPAAMAVDDSPVAARAEVGLQPEFAPATAASITTAALPAVPASNDAPLRSASRRMRASVATVTVEAVGESKLGRFVGKIPGLRRLEKTKHGFIPARPIRQIAPSVPASRELARDVPVDVKLTVDPAGNVASVEPTRGADRQLTRLAADAARNWQFEPARRNEETVSSELILHFTFKPPNQAE